MLASLQAHAGLEAVQWAVAQLAFAHCLVFVRCPALGSENGAVAAELLAVALSSVGSVTTGSTHQILAHSFC